MTTRKSKIAVPVVFLLHSIAPDSVYVRETRERRVRPFSVMLIHFALTSQIQPWHQLAKLSGTAQVCAQCHLSKGTFDLGYNQGPKNLNHKGHPNLFTSKKVRRLFWQTTSQSCEGMPIQMQGSLGLLWQVSTVLDDFLRHLDYEREVREGDAGLTNSQSSFEIGRDHKSHPK